MRSPCLLWGTALPVYSRARYLGVGENLHGTAAKPKLHKKAKKEVRPQHSQGGAGKKEQHPGRCFQTSTGLSFGAYHQYPSVVTVQPAHPPGWHNQRWHLPPRIANWLKEQPADRSLLRSQKTPTSKASPFGQQYAPNLVKPTLHAVDSH